MELKPITRQEKIIAGQDLTPITRMEKFLKQYGGGGGGGAGLPSGGTPYQQLVTDGNGNMKWEDRLAYENTVNIIDNQEFVFDNKPIIIGSGDFVIGETYKVFFDTTEYSCECVEMNGVTLIGSVDFSDYPFVFALKNGQIMGMVQNSGTHTIGVIGKSVNRIPEKFLPTFAKTKTIFFNATDDELNEAYEHFKAGGLLYLAGRTVLSVSGSLKTGGIQFYTAEGTYAFTGGGEWKKYGSLTERPSSGDTAPYRFYLHSSTSGSTKQFEITVDDSGTISATEVS